MRLRPPYLVLEWFEIVTLEVPVCPTEQFEASGVDNPLFHQAAHRLVNGAI